MPAKKIDKEILLQKSIEVFREKGYYHTSIADLAEACEVEKPHFYYYFKDKKDLMKEVLAYSQGIVKKYVFSIAYDKSISPKERLEKMMKNTYKINSSYPKGCLMGNTTLETSNSEPEFRPILQAFFQEWVKVLTFLYENQYTRKESREFALEDLQKMQGSIMLSRLYNDFSYLQKTLGQIGKRLK